jgi:hypothetical protein
MQSLIEKDRAPEKIVHDALLVVASTVSVLTIVVIGATMKVLDHLRWIVDRLDRIQATISERDRMG